MALWRGKHSCTHLEAYIQSVRDFVDSRPPRMAAAADALIRTTETGKELTGSTDEDRGDGKSQGEPGSDAD